MGHNIHNSLRQCRREEIQSGERYAWARNEHVNIKLATVYFGANPIQMINQDVHEKHNPIKSRDSVQA